MEGPKDTHYSKFGKFGTILSSENVREAKKDLRQHKHCVLYTEYRKSNMEEIMKYAKGLGLSLAVSLLASTALAEIKVAS